VYIGLPHGIWMLLAYLQRSRGVTMDENMLEKAALKTMIHCKPKEFRKRGVNVYSPPNITLSRGPFSGCRRCRNRIFFPSSGRKTLFLFLDDLSLAAVGAYSPFSSSSVLVAAFSCSVLDFSTSVTRARCVVVHAR
jgi:hypothetical protein